MTRYSDQIRDEFNRPVPGVAIYVYDLDTSVSPPVVIGLSTLTDDTALPLANPLTSDEFGDFYFNAADGQKRLEFHYGGALRWKEQILVGPLPPGPTGSVEVSGVEFITPKQFGAVVDGTINDYSAFTALQAFRISRALPNYGYAYGIPKATVSDGVSLIGANTLDLYGTGILSGQGSGLPGGGVSVLKFTGNTTGIRVQNHNTSGASSTVAPNTFKSGAASILEGLDLEGGYSGASGDYHGVHLRVMAVLRDTFIEKFPGDGVYARAQLGAGGALEGNVNLARVERVWAEQCRNGFFFQGNDANACSISFSSAVSNREYGFNDSSFLGNTWIACHAAGNTLGGYHSDPANANAAPLFIGCYDEGGQPTPVFGPKTLRVGGFWGSGAGTGGALIQATGDALSVISANGVTADHGIISTGGTGNGYGVGAGGAVVQATNKSTAVTLNKPTGKITMNAASLAANTSVGFNLNNSCIAVDDVVVVSIRDGGSILSYFVGVDVQIDGIAHIHLRNITAGALAEAVILNFAIIKGASS